MNISTCSNEVPLENRTATFYSVPCRMTYVWNLNHDDASVQLRWVAGPMFHKNKILKEYLFSHLQYLTRWLLLLCISAGTCANLERPKWIYCLFRNKIELSGLQSLLSSRPMSPVWGWGSWPKPCSPPSSTLQCRPSRILVTALVPLSKIASPLYICTLKYLFYDPCHPRYV